MGLIERSDVGIENNMIIKPLKKRKKKLGDKFNKNK
jgi:hypothetical protein